MLRVICMVCDRTLSLKCDGTWRWPLEISHGLCQACYAKGEEDGK